MKNNTTNIQPFTYPVSRIGYKIALKENDKYYSIFSGMRYTLGNIRAVKSRNVIQNSFIRLFNKPIVKWTSFGAIDNDKFQHFVPELVSNTMVFANSLDALKFRNSYKKFKDLRNRDLVILIVELGNIKYIATSFKYPVYIGDNIISITETKV